MVSATKAKKSAKAKQHKEPKVKQPTKAEKDAARLKELDDYAAQTAAAERDVVVAQMEMEELKSEAKEATARFNSAVGRLRRLVNQYANPQRELPIFHGNGSVNGHQPPTVEDKKPEPAPKADPTLAISTEPWRSVLLSTIPGITKQHVQKFADNHPKIETLGDLVDWQKSYEITDVMGIGPGAAEKIGDAMEAYWKANPQPDAKAEESNQPQPAEAGA